MAAQKLQAQKISGVMLVSRREAPGAEGRITWDQYRDIVQVDAPILIEGRLDKTRGAPQLSASKASSLLVNGKLMTVSVYAPERMKARQWDKIERFVQEAGGLGFTPMVLMATTPETVESVISSPQILASAYFADRKKLLTLNRSNGGATFIDDGLIVTKWSLRQLPDRPALEELAETDVTESLLSEDNSHRVKFQAFLLYVFAVMLLL